MKSCAPIGVVITIVLGFAGFLRADFAELTTSANIHPVNRSAVAWGDYDNDGDLDLAISGDGGTGRITKIYRNDNARFTDIDADLVGCFKGALAWGDYDADGDLDLALCGDTDNANDRRVTRIYRNDDGSFADSGVAGLTGVIDACLSWVDFDNDMDLDLFVAGRNIDGQNITRIYRNDGGGRFNKATLGPNLLRPGTARNVRIDPRDIQRKPGQLQQLSPITVALPGVASGSADWTDFDEDGDLDLLLTGSTGNARISHVYRNEGGQFSKANIDLPGIFQGSGLWIDYDTDGDMDILLVGATQVNAATRKLFRNDGTGKFAELDPRLPQHASHAQLTAGDYDNDGDPDLLMWGTHIDLQFSGVLNNNPAGVFNTVEANLPGPNYGPSLLLGAFAWADVDKDGDLDALVTGSIPPQHNKMSRIFANTSDGGNEPPAAPTGLSAKVEGDSVTLTWQPAASDDHTPPAALTYNLRLTGPENLPAMSRANGFRQIVAPGNCGQSTTWTLHNLRRGRYTWTVQAVDSGYVGGPFARVQGDQFATFTVSGPTPRPRPDDPRNIPKDKQEEGRPPVPKPGDPFPRPGPNPGPGPDPRPGPRPDPR